MRRTPQRRGQASSLEELPNDLVSPLFLAAIEATEEAIYDSLLLATTIESRDAEGQRVRGEALPLQPVRALIHQYGRGQE